MHMADALLSPAVGATFWAGTIAAISWSARKLRETIDEKLIPLMGVLGAFVFAAQMINFTIPGTGSSGHLSGGLLLAIILGPYAAFLTIASVLTVQAFFFADGGLLALGCNIWNLGIYPCFVGYPLIYKALVRTESSPGRIVIASALSGTIGLQLGAFSVVLQTLLSGRSDLPIGAFLLLMQPLHLAIGLVEGLVTAGVINFIRTARPEILESAATSRPLAAGISIRNVVLVLLMSALAAGGALSWFASVNPDGLEWSIEKVFGKPGLREDEHGVARTLKDLQGKTAVLPDYGFRKPGKSDGQNDGAAWPAVDSETTVSGLVGSALVLASVLLIGLILRALRRKRP